MRWEMRFDGGVDETVGGEWALVSSNVLSSEATSRRLKQMITVTERSKPSVASLAYAGHDQGWLRN